MPAVCDSRRLQWGTRMIAQACRILVQGDPDGDPQRSADFANAYQVVWNFAEELLQTSRLRPKVDALQARLVHGGDDVQQDLIIDLVFYLLRQSHCPGAGQAGDQLRRRAARKLAVRYRQGTASLGDLGLEARRWARNGMDHNELLQLWSSLAIPEGSFNEAKEEGTRDGESDQKWRSMLYGKLSNLIVDRHRRLTREQAQSAADSVEDVAGDAQDAWATEALADLREEVWHWLVRDYVPELSRAQRRRAAKLRAFTEYCQQLERGQYQLSAAQIRRAGRGRDAVLTALYGDLAPQLGAAQDDSPTGIRKWVTALASQPDLNLAALAALLDENSHLSREQALRVVACSLMTHEGRMRRPKQESPTGRVHPEEVH